MNAKYTIKNKDTTEINKKNKKKTPTIKSPKQTEK